MKLKSRNNTAYRPDLNLFGRSIDDIVNHNFFHSFDANVKTYPDHYDIEIAVPGFRKKDLSVAINDGILLVSAWKKEQEPEDTRAEFSYTSFNRSFVLPSDVDESRVWARCRDGILRIRLEKNILASGQRNIPVAGDHRHNRWWANLGHRLRQLFKES